MSLPIELWIKIALSPPHDSPRSEPISNDAEYLFNALVRAVPDLGRWTIGVNSGTHYTASTAIDRRLDLMETFGYSVELEDGSKVFGHIEGIEFDYDFDIKGSDYITWYKNGVPHRNDGPAITSVEGDYETSYAFICRYAWMRHGRVHRAVYDGVGPAIDSLAGSTEWFTNGKRHREGGPAIMNSEFNIEWNTRGVIHRADGPAKIYGDGEIKWYTRGCPYRDNGPAIIRSDGTLIRGPPRPNT